jgi:hypothetical protein
MMDSRMWQAVSGRPIPLNFGGGETLFLGMRLHKSWAEDLDGKLVFDTSMGVTPITSKSYKTDKENHELNFYEFDFSGDRDFASRLRDSITGLTSTTAHVVNVTTGARIPLSVGGKYVGTSKKQGGSY